MGKPQQISAPPPQRIEALPESFLPFAQDLGKFLSGRVGAAPNPYQQNLLGSFFGGGQATRAIGQAPVAPGGFFGQGQNFLGGLLSGQLPESIRAATQENLGLAQGALNSQLQQRGAFFGTPGLQMQAGLARGAAQDLNNLIFQNATQAIPQGLGLFGGAAGLAGIPEQAAMGAVNPLIGLLGARSGQIVQPPAPTYAPDPLTQILMGLLPFFV